MPSFAEKVERYRPTCTRGEMTGSTRFIDLSLVTFPGRVVIRFAADAPKSVGELTKVKGPANSFAYQARVNLPLTDYADYLDLLRHEGPIIVSCIYDTEPALNQKVPVLGCRIYTEGSEPPGEGPVDQSI